MTSKHDDEEKYIGLLLIWFPLAFHDLVDSLNDKLPSDYINLIIGFHENYG
jgi:hypothetical protein